MLITDVERDAELAFRASQRPTAGQSSRATMVARLLYFRWLVPVSLVVGMILRAREWVFEKSLWLDELGVTYSITHRGFGGLLHPLDHGQAGPIGWLWAERASIELFGLHDWALRFPAWAASIVALGVFPIVARRLVGRSAVPAATLVFATSPVLIYYGAEAKQYSSDTACTLLALLATTQLCRDRPTFRRTAIWGFICAVLVWCSQPTILVSAVCGLVLLLVWFRQRETLGPVLVGGTIFTISVAVNWWVALRHQSANTFLEGYWRAYGGYPPVKQTLRSDLSWLATTAARTAGFMHIGTPVLAFGLMACGLAVLARRRPVSALLLGLPIGAAAGVAITGHYPLTQRLALYLYPYAVMLLAAPLALSSRDPNPVSLRWKWTATVASAALTVVAAAGIAAGLRTFVDPDETTAGRQAVAFVSRHQQPGDVVLIAAATKPTIDFYGRRYHVMAGGIFGFDHSAVGVCGDPFSTLAGVPRVWLVLAHHGSSEPRNRTQIYLSQMAVESTLLLSYHGAGDAGAYLFDLSMPPAKPPVRLAPFAEDECFYISRSSTP
jgi:4-amino-4-deoxy-L-arabinose transferase-like glycosyltransferase